jgi:hypothetical protein
MAQKRGFGGIFLKEGKMGPVGEDTNRGGARCFYFMLQYSGSLLSKLFFKTASAYSKTAIFLVAKRCLAQKRKSRHLAIPASPHTIKKLTSY